MSTPKLPRLASIPEAGSKAQILIVNNHAETTFTLENILRQENYQVTKASSEKETLMLVTQQNFSLILIDVQLSTLNAFNIIRIIKTNEKINRIPIILIAPENKDLINIINEYNVDNIGYIFTPVDPKTFSLKVARTIKSNSFTLNNNQLSRPTNIPTQFNQTHFQKHTQILENIAEAYLVINKNWRITYYNQAASSLLDFHRTKNSKTQLIGCSLWELLTNNIEEQVYDYLQEAMRRQKTANIIISAYDTNTWFKLRAYPIEEGLILYCIDITEQKKLEEELNKLKRLKLIAQIAAGITHEIRNPITVVRAVLELARLANKPISEDKINIMIQEIDRANSIISEFLALTNTKEFQKELIALDQLVTELLPLIEAEVSVSQKHLILNLQKCKPIYLCSKKIGQLIFNLVFNGLEAMKIQGENLTIQTYQEQNDICLKITNDGPRIDVGDLDSIWDPFFTTKENGTGLGLAICNSIASNHNGIIDVETNHKETSFIVRFKNNVSKSH